MKQTWETTTECTAKHPGFNPTELTLAVPHSRMSVQFLWSPTSSMSHSGRPAEA